MHCHEDVEGIAFLINNYLDEKGFATVEIVFDKRISKRDAKYIIRLFQTYAARSVFRMRHKIWFRINPDALQGNYKTMFFDSSDDICYIGGDPDVFVNHINRTIDYKYKSLSPLGIEEKTQQFCLFLRCIFFKYKYIKLIDTTFPWDAITGECIWSSSIGYDNVMALARTTLDDKKFIKFKMLYEEGIYWFKTRMGADLSLCDLLSIIFRGDYDAIDDMFRQSALMSEMWENDKYCDNTINKAIRYFFKYYGDTF